MLWGKFPRGICARGVKEKFTRVDSSSSLKCVFLGNSIMYFHSGGQHLCKFIGTKESVYIRKEFNSHRSGFGHKHGRRFIVLGHKYGRHDVM